MVFSKAISAALLVGAAASMVGCATKAPIPLAENFDLTVQSKVRSAGHWELVSGDVVSQTLATLDKVGLPAGTQIYVGLPPNPSPFDLAFRDFLITKFVQSGVPVQQNPGQTLDISYHAQVVRHNTGAPTNTEMVLTTTVMRGSQYLARKTDVYYLENVDAPLFMRSASAYKNMNMKVVSQ